MCTCVKGLIDYTQFQIVLLHKMSDTTVTTQTVRQTDTDQSVTEIEQNALWTYDV